jgi:hypothetical protein
MGLVACVLVLRYLTIFTTAWAALGLAGIGIGGSLWVLRVSDVKSGPNHFSALLFVCQLMVLAAGLLLGGTFLTPVSIERLFTERPFQFYHWLSEKTSPVAMLPPLTTVNLNGTTPVTTGIRWEADGIHFPPAPRGTQWAVMIAGQAWQVPATNIWLIDDPQVKDAEVYLTNAANTSTIAVPLHR